MQIWQSGFRVWQNTRLSILIICVTNVETAGASGPYDSAPYLDKFTLFANVEDMDNSKNEGFTVLNKAEVSCRVRYLGNIMEWKSGEKTEIPEALCKVMETVCRDYDYLIQ